MKLSTTTNILNTNFGIKKTIDIISDAGFDAADFSQFESCIYEEIPDKAYYTEIKKYAEDKGIFFNQSHAPYGSSFVDEEQSKIRFDEIVRAIKRASYLGVKNIIVHPCQHLEYDKEGNPERLFEYNMNFYPKLKPYCEEYGIRVALENMWQSVKGMATHSTCSRPDEFIRYLDELNDPCFVACLDIGHSYLAREDTDDFIRRLGNKRLQCLHVHDVDGTHDMHTLPYFGSVNWDKVMSALKEVGYTGDFTFEADCFFIDKPREIMPEASKYMCKTGRYLISKIEG